MSDNGPSSTVPGQGQGTSLPTTTSAQSSSNTATLYLFTFLATILILVLLTASLVLRSYILRRRYRQRFQQALSDTLLDQSPFDNQYDLSGMRRSARRLGPKPVLWDTWIDSVDGVTWSSISPVAVRCIPASPPASSSPSPVTPSVPSPPHGQSTLFSYLRLPSPPFITFIASSPRCTHSTTTTNSRSRSPPPPPPPPPPSPHPITRAEKDVATLEVCVLVTLPDAAAPVYRAVSNVKGKGVDPLESPAPLRVDVDPLLLSPRSRADVRPASAAQDDEGLPLLQLAVLKVGAEDRAWT